MSCEYVLVNPFFCEINEKSYIEENILLENNYNSFKIFLSEIIEVMFGIKIYPRNNQQLPNFGNIPSIGMNSSNNYTSNSSAKIINQVLISFPKFKIIEFIQILGRHNGSPYYIKEIKKGTFISGGTDDKIKFYPNNKKDLEIQGSLGFFHFKEDNRLVIFTKNALYIRDYDSDTSPTYQQLKDFQIRNIVYLGSKAIFICTENNVLLLTDFLNTIIQTTKHSIIEKRYMGGIKINDNIVAFVSNKLLSNGENKIIFYNINTTKINESAKLNGYSYTISKNNLALITMPKKYGKTWNNQFLLFCGCKKYCKHDKNGILFAILEIKNKNNIEINKVFYHTKSFEVYCFCPIFRINYRTIFQEDSNQINEEETEYILVGGFDSFKKEGLIKLYKILVSEDGKIKLEFIIDITVEKNVKGNGSQFKGFKMPITCIIQSKDNGNILICCQDGNIISFCEPFIDNLINMDKINIL